MTNLFLFGAIVSLAIQANAIHVVEPHNGKPYYIQTLSRYSWYTARADCHTLDMTLVAIETRDKQNEINKMLTNYFPSDVLSGLELWTAGNDRNHKGIYEWGVYESTNTTDNKIDIFTNWAKDETNDYNYDENCIALNASDFLWTSYPCRFLSGYICEGKLIHDRLELQQSHIQALSVAVGKKQEELDHLKEYLEIQLEEKNKEIDNLRKSCESKVLSHIDKKIYELRSQRHQDLEELKKINESPRILELTNTNKSLEDERNIVPQDKKNENLWTLINRHHDYNRNLLRQVKDHELEAPQKDCVYKELGQLAIVKKPQEGDDNLLR